MLLHFSLRAHQFPGIQLPGKWCHELNKAASQAAKVLEKEVPEMATMSHATSEATVGMAPPVPETLADGRWGREGPAELPDSSSSEPQAKATTTEATHVGFFFLCFLLKQSLALTGLELTV